MYIHQAKPNNCFMVEKKVQPNLIIPLQLTFSKTILISVTEVVIFCSQLHHNQHEC